MDHDYKDLTEYIQSMMWRMTAGERVAFLADVPGDFCPSCGYDNGGNSCQCQNDE